MFVLSFRTVREVRKKDTRIIPRRKAEKVQKPLYFATSLCATRNNPALGMMAQIVQTGRTSALVEHVSKISAPTLVAIADEVLALSLEQAQRIHSRIATSTRANIPRAGHIPTVEEPSVVNTLLEDLWHPGA